MEDKKICVALIKAVKSRPCLYDFNMVEFADKEITEQAWEEVAQETGLNAYKCKEKWRNMKIVLKRHLRKGVIKRRRKYYLFDYLRFVIPFMKVTNPEIYNQTCNVDAKMEKLEKFDVNNDSVPEVCDSHSTEITTVSTPLEYCETKNHASLIDHTYNNDDVSQNQFEYHVPLHTDSNSRNRVTEEVSEIDETFMELSNSRKKQEEDAKKAFLMSLLPDLYLMNGQQTRYFKRRVLEAVDDILDGNVRT